MEKTSPDAIVVDSYEPDYDSNCEACGDSPTVTVVKDGKTIASIGLCGPCTWGEAGMLDPDKWND